MFLRCRFCINFILVVTCLGAAFAAQQRVKARGQLICPAEPSKAIDLKIKLIDYDRASPDDLMAEMHTTNTGNFTLEGSAGDPFGNIDPYLKFYHTCNNRHWVGKREIYVGIPDLYINSESFFDLGIMNIEFITSEYDPNAYQDRRDHVIVSTSNKFKK